MDSPVNYDHLQKLLRAFFNVARQQHQAQGIEPKTSNKKPNEQRPHLYDHMVDIICKDLNLPNPGTDQHSLNIWPHPITGWAPEIEEQMRRSRIRLSMEKGKSSDAEWLASEGLRMTKDGWVRYQESGGYGG